MKTKWNLRLRGRTLDDGNFETMSAGRIGEKFLGVEYSPVNVIKRIVEIEAAARGDFELTDLHFFTLEI